MKSQRRDLLVLLKTASLSSERFEKEMECLNAILLRVECDDVFCQAHELATRFSITEKKGLLLKAAASVHLKPFHFLINKN